MAFNWRREPSNPYLPADGSLAQMAANSMAGYQPLTAMTPHGNGMNGYFSNNAIANNSQGFSVPNQQHGGMAQPDLEGYGASLQAASDAVAQAQAKEQQIASIQSQITSHVRGAALGHLPCAGHNDLRRRQQIADEVS